MIAKLLGILTLATLMGGCVVTRTQEQDATPEKHVADKPFAAGGNIEMQLDSGNYVIRPATDDHIRVSFGGNTGDANADVSGNMPRATVSVTNTPHNNFHAWIDVPQSANVVIHLKAGNLELSGITGDKDITGGAGNVDVAVGDPDDYASVDASLKAGEIDAGAFGKSESGLSPHFTWQGHGKYTLHASLGAGNLVFKRK